VRDPGAPVGKLAGDVVPKARPVASPFVVFERGEVGFVAGSLLLVEAGETAATGPQGP